MSRLYIHILYKNSAHPFVRCVSIISRPCSKIIDNKFNLSMYISARQLYKLPIPCSQSACKITSVCRSTQYVRAGCTRVQSRFCEGLEVGTRRDAAQGMFRRVGRTHTGGGKTWWPTGCGIHQRRCSAYLLRSRLFYRFPCTRVPRHGKRDGKRGERKRERKREEGGREWLSMRKTLH